MSIFGKINDVLTAPGRFIGHKLLGIATPEQQAVDEQRKKQLSEQAAAAGGFADVGQQGYGQLGTEANQSRQFLRDLASGKTSLAGEQLRQGMQQGQAAQMSMAAGAAPGNAAMAARNAAMNMGRLGYGLSGQQAVAGIQERKAAQEALMNAILQQRQQDLQAALQSRSNAMTGYGANQQVQPAKGLSDVFGPALMGGLGAALLSDERLKDNKGSGDEKAEKLMTAIKARRYRYKDEKHGKGEQLGIMAQDLERGGLKGAVMETPIGKAVDVAKLTGANTAMLAAVHRRLKKLEGKR